MIGTLRAANAEYDQNIAFVYVDWDTHRLSPISRRLRVNYQSTLVMMSEAGEIDRVVGQTSTEAIKGLLDKAPARAKDAEACSS